MSFAGGTTYSTGTPQWIADVIDGGQTDLPLTGASTGSILPGVTDFGTVYASQGSNDGNSDTTTDANVPWWVWLIAGIALLLILKR